MIMEIQNAGVRNAATRAVEQGQAHRAEATAAAKTRMVDPYPRKTLLSTADFRLDV